MKTFLIFDKYDTINKFINKIPSLPIQIKKYLCFTNESHRIESSY